MEVVVNIPDLLREIPGTSEVSGRLSVPENADALAHFGAVCEKTAAAAAGAEVLILTGPGPVWSYLILFHAVAHRVKEVSYLDGKNNRHLICKHG